jgi:hypothetical protein
MRIDLVVLIVAALVATGCGGGNDGSREVAIAPPATEEPVPPAPAPAAPVAGGGASTPAAPEPTPLPTSERAQIATRAGDTQAAIGRWDDQLAACIGPSGNGDDADSTCTHAAWEELVDQVEVAMYYLLDDLRAMPRGSCHDALASENDLLRAFWHGAAPLNLVWLDEQQRPPSLFDLQAAVDLLRPVPGRVRDTAATVCAA